MTVTESRTVPQPSGSEVQHIRGTSLRYVMRSQHVMVTQGDHEPWTHMIEHEQEMPILPNAELDEGSLVYS